MIKSLKQQFWEGLVIVALGAGILLLAPSQIKGFTDPDIKVHPSFISNLAGVGFLITGTLISVTSFFKKNQKKEKGETVKIEDIKKIGITVIILFAYSFLFSIIGFLTTSMLFIGILSFILGQRKITKLLTLMIVVPVSVWILFELIFVIPLPHGWLF